MILLTNRFNKTLKCFNKKPYSSGNNPGVNDKQTDKGWKNSISRGSNSGFNHQNKRKGIQCRECEGFGYIQVECPNYVKKQSKSYYTTLSYDDSNEEEWIDIKVINFVSFTYKISIKEVVNPTVIDHPFDNINDDEQELTEEELMANYQMLFMKWSKLTKAYATGETECSLLV
ncbi:hypothetical protein LIER_10368 [Lithospermum erythrorhizon]|uniref:Gag-pol polyprotein n=1 Tax=Lithospermum erythrorhizon TaxID=34254 RepID=A0AAV3PKU8_LITER